MPAYEATAVFKCKCGAETHVFMECDIGPTGDRINSVYCWRCGETAGVVPATRIWSSSTAQGARRLRLMGLHDAMNQVPRNPADYKNTQSPVWDVL
jgi:hypothetical protein